MTEKLALNRATDLQLAGWHGTEVDRAVPTACAQPLLYRVDAGKYLYALRIPSLPEQRP